MSTRTARKPVAPVASAQVTEAVATDAVVSLSKKTAYERLTEVLVKIEKTTAKPIDEPADVKWGKALGLLGGGSVYINRSNADVRSTTKQVADWSKAGLGTVRGPQGQYLRIAF